MKHNRVLSVVGSIMPKRCHQSKGLSWAYFDARQGEQHVLDGALANNLTGVG